MSSKSFVLTSLAHQRDAVLLTGKIIRKVACVIAALDAFLVISCFFATTPK